MSDLSRSARGLVRTFHEAEVLGWADVHAAQQTLGLAGESDESVALAMALTVRALRAGSLNIDVAKAATHEYLADEHRLDVAGLPWPDPQAWRASIAASPAVTVGEDETARRPLRLIDDALYLERYWRAERAVWTSLLGRLDAGVVPYDPVRARAHLDVLLPDQPALAAARTAAALAVTSRLSVIAGGPGTGKTSTIARILALLWELEGPELRVGLAAPTGKAAARMQEAIHASDLPVSHDVRTRLATVGASTIHRLLGSLPDSRTRFRHHEGNPLPQDVVIVDEMSMVSITMMARLLGALRSDARLVLVGDPFQLASIDAGTVLADITHRDMNLSPELSRAVGDVGGVTMSRPTITLTHNWRFGGEIAALADAVVSGDSATALAQLAVGKAVRLVPDSEGIPAARERAVTTGERLFAAAAAGDAHEALAALDSHRLLCAHRHGQWGVASWQAQVERWLRQELPGYGDDGEWYVGRPLLATQNAPDLGLFNGDTGVIVQAGDGVRAAFSGAGRTLWLSPFVLDGVVSLFAMTIHKSQGSQFDDVTIVLPGVESPLLTRELLYTAVTRAKNSVTIIGSREALTKAIERSSVR